MAHGPLEKIQALDAIEKEIMICLQSAGSAFQELSKEKSSQKSAENHTQQFLKSLNAVESKLLEQINYLTQVSTGQPHEGSGYASAKVLQMAWHRIQHAKSRLRELEDSKVKYAQAIARQQNRVINGPGGGVGGGGGGGGHSGGGTSSNPISNLTAPAAISAAAAAIAAATASTNGTNSNVTNNNVHGMS